MRCKNIQLVICRSGNAVYSPKVYVLGAKGGDVEHAWGLEEVEPAVR